MADVFISYSRRDIAFARLIRGALQQSQVDTWIDWDRIPVGERWWPEITEAIEGANVFMLIISRNSLASKVCRDEIVLALRNHKRIVPILVDQLTPQEVARLAPDLPQFNWVVFERDKNFRLEVDPAAASEKPEDREVALAKMPQFEDALRKLSVAIHTDWEWVKFHTRLQVEALRWNANQRDASYVVHGTALAEAEQQLFRAAGRDPQPTSLQVEYVTASREEEARSQQERLGLERKARRRQRYVLAAVAVGLVVSSTLGIVAWGQRNQYLDEAHARATAQAQTEEQRQEAVKQRDLATTAQALAEQQRQVADEQRQVAVDQRNIAVSRQLAAQANNRIDNQEVDLGLLLAVEADRHADTMDARSSLLRMILAEPHIRYYISGKGNTHGDTVSGVAISPDGKTMASSNADGTIGLYDVATGKPSHPDLSSPALSSPDPSSSASRFWTVAFSPDGRYLASGEGGRTGVGGGQIVLWDVARDYAPEVILKGSGWIASLSFSPDGKQLAAGTSGGKALIYSIALHGPVCPSMDLPVENSWVAVSVVFSPDGRTLAVGDGSRDDGMNLSFWNTATCAQIGSRVDTAQLAGITDKSENGYVTGLAYSPDGKQLSVAVNTRLVVIDPATRRALRKPVVISPNRFIDSLSYSRDGSVEALAISDKTIVLLNPSTGEAAGQPLIGSRATIGSLIFGPVGLTLASADWIGGVNVWDLANDPLATTLTGHTDSVNAVRFSPDGRLLASVSADQTVRLWDTTTWGQVGRPLDGSHGGILALAFSPDGNLLATGGKDGSVRFWNVATGQPVGSPLDDLGGAVECIAYSPDGKWLAAGGDGNHLAVWNAISHAKVLASTFDTPPLSVNPAGIDTSHMIGSVGFTPDSTTLYFSEGAGVTRFLSMASIGQGSDLAIRQLIWTGTSDRVVSQIAPDGKTIALANLMDIRIYDVATENRVGLPIFGHTNEVGQLAYTPDGSILASASSDHTVRLWNTATAQGFGLPITWDAGYVMDLTVSPEGKWLAMARSDGTVKVIDLQVADWESLACSVVGRDLSDAEWRQFLPTEAYRPTCPGQPADAAAGEQITGLARSLQDAGQKDEAAKMISDALSWVVASDDAGINNDLCLGGSLDGFAAQVMPACERAVALAPADALAEVRDSRGLARALTGDSTGAIEDFQAMVDWSRQHSQYDTAGKEREGWIAALKAGKNPFDKTTLDALRSE